MRVNRRHSSDVANRSPPGDVGVSWRQGKQVSFASNIQFMHVTCPIFAHVRMSVSSRNFRHVAHLISSRRMSMFAGVVISPRRVSCRCICSAPFVGIGGVWTVVYGVWRFVYSGGCSGVSRGKGCSPRGCHLADMRGNRIDQIFF